MRLDTGGQRVSGKAVEKAGKLLFHFKAEGFKFPESLRRREGWRRTHLRRKGKKRQVTRKMECVRRRQFPKASHEAADDAHVQEGVQQLSLARERQVLDVTQTAVAVQVDPDGAGSRVSHHAEDAQ